MQFSLFSSVVDAADETVATSLSELSTPIDNAVFTVIDLETTGLSAKKNAITEITAIRFTVKGEVGKYSTLVQPTEPIPPEVESLTGISNEMVQGAPALVMALSELCRFVGTSPIIVGHNVPFDIGFLREKLEQTGLSNFMDRFVVNKALCTRVLAKKALPGLPSYEGIVVATQCGVYNPNPHRAESDVRMSAGILFALIKRLREEGQALDKLEDLLNYQGLLSER